MPFKYKSKWKTRMVVMNLSQRKLSEITGINESHISRLIRGKEDDEFAVAKIEGVLWPDKAETE